MMKEESFDKIKNKALILEIEPETEYMGEVYTQEVLIEMTDSQIIKIFDPDMLCTTDMVGKTKTHFLFMLVYSLKKLGGEEMKIIPSRNSDDEINYYGTVLSVSGKIEEITTNEKTEKWQDVIVDFGVGSIRLGVNIEEYGHLNFKIGDFIQATGRVYLTSIE